MSLYDVTPIVKLSKDIRNSAKGLTREQARYLVSTYYDMQESRIRAQLQVHSLAKRDKSYEALEWVREQNKSLEESIKKMLDRWTDEQPLGRWAKSITGIGPVISAGLLAHIDVYPWRCGVHNHDKTKKACTEAHPHEGSPTCHRYRIYAAMTLWRFAGIDGYITWNKGELRPWNGALKRLCFLIGESFVKTQNLQSDFYGKLYASYKKRLIVANEAGKYAKQAKEILASRNFGADTQARGHLEKGMLPPAQIHARARRYAVKIFLSHYHAEAFRLQFGEEPPKPYAIAVLGHGDMINPPTM